MSNLLKQSLETAKIIYKGSYPYVIHPLFDGFPQIPPELLKEVTSNIQELIVPYLPFDKIVTIEAMGIPLATQLSQHLEVPFTIIRKNAYNISDEISVNKRTGYATSTLYINGIKDEESIILVDDVISTGGTIQSVINILQDIDIKIKAGFFIIDKGDRLKKLSKITGVPLFSLLKVRVENNKVIFH
jgi:adenine phosphoribosyltransferase